MKRLAVLLLVVAMLAACAPPTPQVIKETVVVTKVVEKPVEVTKVVEKVVEKEVVVTPTPVDYGKVAFISTQCVPVEEAEKMRGVILADFPGQVEFIPADYATFEDTVMAEVKAGKGKISVIGALHGQFPTLVAAGALQDLSHLVDMAKERGTPDAFIELGKYGTDKQYFIPWMQATYICAANKKALEYLPEGADPENLTWEQYRDWAKNRGHRREEGGLPRCRAAAPLPGGLYLPVLHRRDGDHLQEP